jgi:hypothetical protein
MKIHRAAKIIITTTYAMYAASFLFMLIWFASVYVIHPLGIQYDLFGRHISGPLHLTYVQDAITLDGTYYEWEYSISAAEHRKLQPTNCVKVFFPKRDAHGFSNYPYCRVSSKVRPLSGNSRYREEAYLSPDLPALRLVYDRGEK